MMAATLNRTASEYCWECNECGSQEFKMNISEEDLDRLSCTECGGVEFHRAAIREGSNK